MKEIEGLKIEGPEQIKIIGHRVLILSVKPEKVGTIHIPGNATTHQEIVKKNYIVAKGEGDVCDQLEIGDEVLVDIQRAAEVPLNGISYLLIDANGVIAVKHTMVS